MTGIDELTAKIQAIIEGHKHGDYCWNGEDSVYEVHFDVEGAAKQIAGILGGMMAAMIHAELILDRHWRDGASRAAAIEKLSEARRDMFPPC